MHSRMLEVGLAVPQRVDSKMKDQVRPRKMTAIESATLLAALQSTPAAKLLRSHLMWCDTLEDKASDALKGIRAHLGRCSPGDEIHCLMLLQESLAELDQDVATERRNREAAERDRISLIRALQRHRDMLKAGRPVEDILADLREALKQVGNDDESLP
jgi:hypothetical protein